MTRPIARRACVCLLLTLTGCRPNADAPPANVAGANVANQADAGIGREPAQAAVDIDRRSPEERSLSTGDVPPASDAGSNQILDAAGRRQAEGILADELAHGDQRGDWDTEGFHEAARQRLGIMERAIVAEGTQPLPELSGLLTADFRTSALRPQDSELQRIWQDENLQVWRPTSSLPASEPADGRRLTAMLDHLTRPFKSRAGIEVHLKIFRVETDGATGSTEIYVDTDGRANGPGGVQQNMTWRCHWRRGDDNLWQLTSLELVSFEEVHYQTATGRLFADCTAAVLSQNSAFADQLLHSVDHWRLSLEQRHGVDAAALTGLNVADVNGDGLDDVYLCEIGGLPNRLFLQQADGRAIDASASAGIDWLDRAHGALFVDWDNDGDQDLAVSVGPLLLILRNDGAGQFTVAGQLRPQPTAHTLAAADYDNDGLVDLYVCSYGNDYESFADSFAPLPYHDANNGTANTLFRNMGQCTFHDVTHEVGLDANNRRFSFAASWEDFDNDGDQDLYVANDFGRNNLYVNDVNRSGRFWDRAADLQVEDLGSGMSVSWGDCNNDGLVDLYVGNMFSSAGNRIAFQPRFRAGHHDAAAGTYQRFARGNSLFLNRGEGAFRDVSVEAGVAMGRWAWSSLMADINNDGWQDVLVTNGYISGVEPDDL